MFLSTVKLENLLGPQPSVELKFTRSFSSCVIVDRGDQVSEQGQDAKSQV